MTREGRIEVMVTAAVLVATMTTLSCGPTSGTAGSWRGSVTIDVDLEAAQRWTAAGTPVDQMVLCEAGTRQLLDGIDPATNQSMRYSERYRILEEAIGRRISTEIVWIVEHTCTDGSGSFVTREHWGPDVWSVESGTGAYSELGGGGTLSFAPVDHTRSGPLELQLDGELQG